MRFHKTNKISQNFSGITIDFCEIAKSFVDFRSLSLSLPSKDDCKILVTFEQIQNFKILHFLMAKVIKVNIAVT